MTGNPPEVLALDIGGTKLAAGIVDGSGSVRERRVVPTDRDRGAEHVLERALCLVEELQAAEGGAGRRHEALGVSTNGLTREDGVDLAPAVPGWSAMRIPGALRSRFPDLRVTTINDVKAAALAELTWGELRGVREGLYVNLGTGLAAGIVSGGRLLQGANGAAGEFGYMVPSLEALGAVVPGDVPLEDRLGGRAIESRTREELGRPASMAELMELAGRDEAARRLRDRVLEEIALWVANVAVVLDPQTVVLGGGMMRSAGALRRVVRETLGRMAPFQISVVTARFGAESALLGAGVVALPGLRPDRGATGPRARGLRRLP